MNKSEWIIQRLTEDRPSPNYITTIEDERGIIAAWIAWIPGNLERQHLSVKAVQELINQGKLRAANKQIVNEYRFKDKQRWSCDYFLVEAE